MALREPHDVALEPHPQLYVATFRAVDLYGLASFFVSSAHIVASTASVWKGCILNWNFMGQRVCLWVSGLLVLKNSSKLFMVASE